MKLNRGKLVRKYIGEGIAPFKFEYCGYQGDSWKFQKKFGQVTQTISIYPYRFDNHMITFELYTDARETGLVQAAGIEGIEADNYQYGYWKYEDSEESFIFVLEQMKDVLIKKGMKILKDLSVSPEIIADNEMVRNIYYRHDELSEKFIREHGIEVTGYDAENLDRWFEVIEERVRVLQQGPYEDAKEELSEMAAFLGVQIIKYIGGEWYHFVNGNFESCSVHKLKSNVTCANCINLLLGGYAENGMGWTKGAFLEIYEGRKK